MSGYGYVVLVCGGRDYHDDVHVFSVLDALHRLRTNGITLIVQGGASGADTHAKNWARVRSVACATVEAEWARHGRSAGPKRNQEMLDLYGPHMVVAFPGGRGTADMVARARRGGFEVEEKR